MAGRLNEGFGLSKTEIGGIIGGLLFLLVAITRAVIAVVCNRRKDRKRAAKYNFPDYYRSLSLRLCQVIEDVGISTASRDEHVKGKKIEEMLLTIPMELIKGSTSVYSVGSDFEATTFPELDSDRDVLVVRELYPVITEISDAQLYHCCFLMIQDSSTPPGYSKLQVVINVEPQFVSPSSSQLSDYHRDKEDRVVLVDPFDKICRNSVSHGPAESTELSPYAVAQDIVQALRCRTIPDCASEWFTRQRHHNWPTADCIDKCKTLGCFFVQAGHPYSEEHFMEWRLSFSLQERLLVTSFNSAQLKCYVTLKIIKKEIIKPALVCDALTSYHCKTCMLYMIENTPAEIWREDNLCYCLCSCLFMIKTWVEVGVCPNYFIPNENMFDGRIFGAVRTKLHEILSSILAADFEYLAERRTDAIGQRFQFAIVSKLLSAGNPPLGMAVYSSCPNQMIRILKNRLIMLNLCQANRQILSFTCKGLRKLTSKFETIETVTEHTREETRYVLSLLLPYMQITYMSLLTVLAHRSHRSTGFIFQLLTSEKWHTVSLESDVFSSKLKQASLLYMLGFYDVSLDILLNLEVKLRSQLGFCSCTPKRFTRYTRDELISINASSAKEFLGFIVPCVMYSSEESDLMPRALCYELNDFIDRGFEGRIIYYKLGMVDGKILLYFLLYLNHRGLDMEANATADLNNIRRLVRTDRYLGHKEVAFNILGWIYKEQGLVREAVECFQESLQLQPEHNAAFQHLRDLIIDLISRQMGIRI